MGIFVATPDIYRSDSDDCGADQGTECRTVFSCLAFLLGFFTLVGIAVSNYRNSGSQP